jgi:hypothetical protein
VIVPEIHCPHQTIILLCSDTSHLNDWDLDLQTPDLFGFYKIANILISSRSKQTQFTSTQEVALYSY